MVRTEPSPVRLRDVAVAHRELVQAPLHPPLRAAASAEGSAVLSGNYAHQSACSPMPAVLEQAKLGLSIEEVSLTSYEFWRDRTTSRVLANVTRAPTGAPT